MMDSLLLYKILKNRTGAEISASGNPAIMSDTLKNNPMNEMKVYGWSKQETTKGKNLFDFSRLVSDGVNAIDYEKQTITVPAKTNNTGYNQTLRDLCPGITPGTYVLSMKRSNPESNRGSYFLEAEKDFLENTPTELTDALLDNHIAWYNNPDSEVENVISEIQIETGTEATDYEPYTGGQPSPSPDYPQEIVSAGANREICIKVRGKNLVDIYGYSASDIPSPEAERVSFNTYGTTLSTTEKTDKLIVNQKIIDGASINSYTSGYFCIGINRKLENDKDYIITFNIDVIQNPFSASAINVLFNGIEAYKAKIIGDKVTVKAKNIEYRERQYVEVRTCGMSMEISNFMITEKDENTIYEPYYEPQTISISTPTGLPAIPVDSDGNYIDANGQQWIADYVDLKLGKLYKKVTRLNLKDVDTMCIAHGFHSNGNGYLSIDVKNMNKKYLPISNRYKSSGWIMENGYVYTPKDNIVVIVDDRFTDKQTAIKLVQNTYVIYALTSQIETDLTPEEIQAYKNLVTYAGTTIVENDAECYMEVSAGGGDTLRTKKLALLLGD